MNSKIEILRTSRTASLEKLGRDSEALEYWRELSRDSRFHKVLSYCLNDLERYSPSSSSPEPHIQSEKNGGYKGILFLVEKLLSGYTEAIKPKNEHAKIST